VIGFSVGGYVAARLSTHWDEKIYDQIDDSDDLSARPGFAALVYLAYLERKNSHNCHCYYSANVSQVLVGIPDTKVRVLLG